MFDGAFKTVLLYELIPFIVCTLFTAFILYSKNDTNYLGKSFIFGCIFIIFSIVCLAISFAYGSALIFWILLIGPWALVMILLVPVIKIVLKNQFQVNSKKITYRLPDSNFENHHF